MSYQVNTKERFFLRTLGCKVNQCDTAGMARELTACGWGAAAPGAVPDLVLVNTCTVTERADRECRQIIRRVLRNAPDTFVIVTGCYAQLNATEIAAIAQPAARQTSAAPSITCLRSTAIAIARRTRTSSSGFFLLFIHVAWMTLW